MTFRFDRQKLRAVLSRLPVISTLLELDPGPRTFLYFITFNLVSWQCVVGPALVLFGRKIGMPASWIGLLISFMPLSMLLVLLTGLLVARFGPKRVMLIAWFLRNALACSVFIMPWAMIEFGPRSAGYVLMAATLGFCLMRAVGVGGWMPWLHEIVPEKQRSSYFSTESAVSSLLNVVVVIAQGLILHGNPGVWRFLIVYGIGIASGFISLPLMKRVPGGAPLPATARAPGGASWSLIRAWKDRPYMAFILFAGFCFASLAWYSSTIVLYMRDALMVSPGFILYLTALGSLVVMLTIGFWGRFADHAGSPHAMALSLSGAACMSLGCIMILPGMRGMIPALAAVVVISAIFGSAFWATVNRVMLGYLKPADRIGYANLWTVFTALAAAITPIIAGHVIEMLGMWGYRACFLLGAGSSFACAIGSLYLVRKEKEFEFPWKQCPFYELPFRFVFSLARISVGLHKSNRPALPGKANRAVNG